MIHHKELKDLEEQLVGGGIVDDIGDSEILPHQSSTSTTSTKGNITSTNVVPRADDHDDEDKRPPAPQEDEEEEGASVDGCPCDFLNCKKEETVEDKIKNATSNHKTRCIEDEDEDEEQDDEQDQEQKQQGNNSSHCKNKEDEEQHHQQRRETRRITTNDNRMNSTTSTCNNNTSSKKNTSGASCSSSSSKETNLPLTCVASSSSEPHRYKLMELQIEVLKEENEDLKKEVNALRTVIKESETKSYARESRLKQTLKSVQNLKELFLDNKRNDDMNNSDMMNKNNSTQKEIAALKEKIKFLEMKNVDLMKCLKKQMQLIAVLKKKNIHLEASRLLDFSQTEFVSALVDWGDIGGDFHEKNKSSGEMKSK